MLSAWQCHSGWGVEPGCPAVRAPSEEISKVHSAKELSLNVGGLAQLMLCDPQQGHQELAQHHSLGDWGGAPGTSGISHCWRRNDIFTPSGCKFPCFCEEYGGCIHVLCERFAFLPCCWALGAPEALTWHLGCAELGIPSAEPALDGAWAVTPAAFQFWCSSCTGV